MYGSMRKSDAISEAKVDTAREQIDLAIEFCFRGASSIAIRTLAAATYAILSSLSKFRNGKFASEEELPIKPEFLGEWPRKTREVAKLFKQVDLDPSATLLFDDNLNDYKLLQCCFGYGEPTGGLTPSMEAFSRWFQIFYPHLSKLEEELRLKLESARKALNAGVLDNLQAKEVGTHLLSATRASRISSHPTNQNAE
jgi:hypothetical protein